MRFIAIAWMSAMGCGAIAQVGQVEVGKMRTTVQSSATTFGSPQFQISAAVFGPPSIPAPVFSGPFAGTRTLGFTGWWHFEGQAPTRAQLDASYPNGTYTVVAGGTAYTFSLMGDLYPNTPEFTLSGGAWVDGRYVIDPAQPLSITTNVFTAYGAGEDAAVHVYLGREGANVFDYWANRSSSPGASSARLTIPAGTMVSGNQYYLGAGFLSRMDIQRGPTSKHAYYGAITNMSVKAERPQVFPMTVTSNITPTVANATATFQPRPQDVGQSASVYVFAVAPSTLVANAALAKSDGPRWKAQGAKADTPVQCLLAQLNASGQLVAVSAAGLTAYVSGVLSAQGSSVNLLNNVSTPTIAGTTFYVGYGTSSQQMIASGVNQRALSVSGNVACDPKSPQTGWWYNADEGGRGFSIETRDNRIFMAAFHYDASGRATWNFAGGAASVDGSLFTADFLGASAGQTLTGAYRLPGLSTVGPITLAFSDSTHGTMFWPGGSTAIERQPIVPNGLTASPQSGLPQSGWWWNPDESGRGFFLEWQNGWVDIAGYMYDDAGNPTWYIAAYPTPNPMLIEGNWWTFANGQAMGQPYRPATRTSDNVGALRVEFSGSTTATMTLPGGRRIPLVRQVF